MSANPVQSLTSMDPLSIGIDLIGDVLGLPPEVKNVAKVAVGVAMADPFLVINGVAGLAENVQQVAQTEWKPPRGGSVSDGYAPPGQGTPAGGIDRSNGPLSVSTGNGLSQDEREYYAAVDVLSRNFDKIETAGWLKLRDGVLSKQDIEAVAKDPNVPEDIRHAAGYLVDHPARMNGLMNSWNPIIGYGLIAPAVQRIDRDRLAAEVREGERRGAYGGNVSSGSRIPGGVGTGGVHGGNPGPLPPHRVGTGGAHGGNPGSWTPGGVGTGGVHGGNPGSWTPGGVGTGGTSASSGSGSNPVHDIMSNPSLSPMEKVEALMQAMADQADDEALDIAQSIEQMQAEQRGLDTKSPEGQKKAAELQQSIDQKMQRMQKLLQRRTEMMALVTNLNQMQHENAMRCIERMAR